MSAYAVVHLSRDELKDPTVPLPDGRCVWWGLPQEMRDTIYKYAFVSNPAFRPISKHLWESREGRHKSEILSYIPKTFPYSPVVASMVSKKSVQEAIEVFYRHTHFDFISFSNMFLYAHFAMGGSGRNIQNHHLNDISHVHVSWDSPSPGTVSQTVASFTGLKTVDLTLKGQWFVIPGMKDPWNETWDEEDFLQLDGTKELLGLRGIKQLSVQAAEPIPKLSSRRVARWKDNLRIFERLLLRHVTQPKRSDLAQTGKNTDRVSAIQAPKAYSQTLPATSQTAMSCKPGIAAHHGLLHTSQADLSDEDIPSDEGEFARLLMTRGTDFFKWAQDAKRRLRSGGQEK